MFEVLGLAGTAPEGEKEQVAAMQTAAPEGAPSGSEPPPSDPAQTGAETATGTEGGAEGAQDEKKPQTPEERAEHAAQRRRAEYSAELEKSKAEMRREFEAERVKMQDEFIRGMGMTDEFTGKPIGTAAEYSAYVTERNRRMADEKLQKAGLDRSVLDAVINTHPDVIRARELAQTATAETLRAQEGSAEQRSSAELAAIQAMDSSVKSLNDVLAKDKYPEIKKLVSAGVSVSAAYRAVYAEDIEKQRVTAAVQQAINERVGKGHMHTDGAPRGGGGVEMPAAVERGYRQAFPDATREELQKKYEALILSQKKG